jgi:NAD(P)-dependent dehydrogenase (short-subunit alcohol dehydrogenase family)
MPTLSAARAANAAFRPAHRPVAVVLGGTGGIGAAIARTLGTHLHGELDVILLGRNSAGAHEVFNALPTPSSSSGSPALREFVPCDATLMRDVARAAGEIRGKLARVNFLVLTPGVMTLAGREETDEGIDRKLALHYYARWKLIHECVCIFYPWQTESSRTERDRLMPLLQAARDADQDARVMTVLHAGGGGKVDLSDLGLKRTFSLSRAASACCSYNDCMVESLAARYPEMAFTHAFPGLVETGIGASSPSRVLRAATPLWNLIFRVAGVTADVCGEHLVAALLATERGAFLVDNKGDPVQKRPEVTDPETQRILWEHTLKETRSEDAATV